MKAKEFDFHPIASRYPLMDDDQLSVLVEDMKANGYDPRFPIVTYEGKILAGRDRYRAARKAGVDPRFIALGNGEDPTLFAERENEHRKHFTQEFLAARRTERVQRIAAARADGKSIRAIAAEEHVSKAQVERDIEEAAEICKSTVPGGTVEPERVKGLDGKDRPAHGKSRKGSPGASSQQSSAATTPDSDSPAPPKDSKKKPVEPPPDAGDAWEPPSEEEQEKDHNAKAAADSTRDSLGFVVPKKLRDHFCDPVLPGAVESLAGFIKHFRKNQPLYPWLTLKATIDALETAQSLLAQTKPYAVHQECGGKGCRDCRNSGYVPRWRHVELEAQQCHTSR